MNQERRYYVYEYYIVETDEVFYVGKGTKDRYKYVRRNKMFCDFYNSHNCSVRKVKDNLTEAEAFMLEHFLIIYYKEETNYRLTNQNCGGLSKGSYFQMSDARKSAYDKMRGMPNKKNKGEGNGMYGKNWTQTKTSEEVIAIGEKISQSLKGHIFTDERRKHQSEARIRAGEKAKSEGRSLSANARPVMIVHKKTLQVVATYPSCRQAKGNPYVKGDLYEKCMGRAKNKKEIYEIMYTSYRIAERSKMVENS